MYENRLCVEVTGFYAPDHEVLGWTGSKVSSSLTLLHCTCFASVISSISLYKAKPSSFHFAPNPSSCPGKSISAHIRSDMSSRIARLAKSSWSCSSHSILMKTWMSKGISSLVWSLVSPFTRWIRTRRRGLSRRGMKVLWMRLTRRKVLVRRRRMRSFMRVMMMSIDDPRVRSIIKTWEWDGKAH